MKRRPWTDEQISLLREFYPHFPTTTVAQAVGRPQDSCYRKAFELGLKKTERYLASDDACRLSSSRRTEAMKATQFKPGLQPWNKGVQGSTGTHPNCRATQFAKGRPPSDAHNYVQVGSHRISKDGYLERKVTDDPSVFPARRWVAVHRLVWQEAYGEIPAGHVVVFKTGRRTADLELITLDIVELVTRRELMQRNTYHRYPKEVARLVQLKGAITRQVNRIAKESR